MKAKLLACFFLSVGLSAFGAPAFPVFVKAVNNVSEMVALNVNDIQNQNIIIRGYASAADSDGALFQYNPISATLTNTTTIFKPTNYNGRWIRVELTTTNGSGSAGAGVAVYDNVTAMISGSVTNDGAVAVVLDQGALFTCDSAASTATTNLFKIYPTSIGLTTALGTWTRQVPNDDIQISWAGTVTRDTIQSALTLLNTEGNGATAWLPSGNSTNLDYTTTITIPDNVTLAGLPGAQLTQTPGQASATAFTLSGASNVKLESFALSMFPASANKAFSVANLTNCAIAGVTGLQPGEWGTLGTNVSRADGLKVFDRWGRENTPQAFGAAADGVTDDSLAFTAALSLLSGGGKMFVPKATYIVSGVGTSTIRITNSNVHVEFEQGAVVRIAAGPINTHNAVYIESGFGQVTNVTVRGGTFIGTYSAGGVTVTNAGFGVRVQSRFNNPISDITISDVTVMDFNTDGFIIDSDASSEMPKRVHVSNLYTHSNQRHGATIAAAEDITIRDSVFRGNGDALNPPVTGDYYSTGLDIEPDSGGTVSRVTLIKCKFLDAPTAGLYAQTGDGLVTENVTLIDCYAAGNKEGFNINSANNMNFVNCLATLNTNAGFYIVRDLNGIMENCNGSSNLVNSSGVYVIGPANTVISGGVFNGNYYGVRVNHGGYQPGDMTVTVTGAEARFNTVGMFLNGVNGAKVNANLIAENAQYGLHGAQMTHSDIVGNLFLENSTSSDQNYDHIILSSTSSYNFISANMGRPAVGYVRGLATASTTNTVTLPAEAINYDGAYTNKWIYVLSGASSPDIRLITNYNGTTKVATISTNWSGGNPDGYFEVTGPNRTGYGVRVSSGCETNKVVGNDFEFNKGQLIDSGTGTIKMWFNASGTELDPMNAVSGQFSGLGSSSFATNAVLDFYRGSAIRHRDSAGTLRNTLLIDVTDNMIFGPPDSGGDIYLSYGVAGAKHLLKRDGTAVIGGTTVQAALTVNGSISSPSTTGNGTTLNTLDSAYHINITGGTVTLPTAVGASGREYIIGTIAPATSGTVATTGGQLIDGAASYSLTASNQVIQVKSDNTNWWTIAKPGAGGGGIANTIVGSGTAGRVPKFNGTTNITDSLILEDNANLVLGQQTELATSVTNGFIYLPTMNGIPVNPPQIYTGSAPLVVDAAHNRMYVYPANSWEPVGNLFTEDSGNSNAVPRFTDGNQIEASVVNLSVSGAATGLDSVTATNAITGGSIVAGATNMVAALAGKEPTIGYTTVNKAGDTMTGTLTVTGFTNTALTASRFVATAADKSSTTTAASAALAATLSDETGTGLAVFGTSPTITYVMPFTSAATRTVESKMEDVVSVLDFGLRNDGVSNTQTNIDNLVLYLSGTSYPHGRIFWPAGDYLLPTTLMLTNARYFSFVGEMGGSTAMTKTRMRVSGSGAGHRGVLSLTSCTDFHIEGIEFVVGGSGADQSVELKADDIPSLSCVNGTFSHCSIRRFTSTAEFTYAALYMRNSALISVDSCVFPAAAKSMRIGNTFGVESGTYGKGHVTQVKIRNCWLYGDIERVYTSQIIYEGNFFDIKTGSSPTAPSCLTAADSQFIRGDVLTGNFCQPAAVATNRTFYVQGTNVLSNGLNATGNRVGEVAIGFDLIYGIATIENNLCLQYGATDKFVNIQSTANKVTVWNNDVDVLTTAGGSEVSDATSGVYKQSPFGAISPNTTRGDITYRNATVNARLAIGAANRVLRSDGTDPSWSQVALATDVSGTLPVANGGSGITSGTSGGVLGYTSSGTLASSAALGASELVLGGGAGATPTSLGTKGTTTTLLHGNAAGAPTFGAVSLTADVTGALPIANGGTAATTAAAARVNLGNDIHRGIADANATLTSADRVVSWTSISAARVCTLPAANTLNAGQELIIGDISGSVSSANTITITRVGADTIDGATTEVIATAYGKRRLISDGSSKWEFDKGVGRLSQAQTWTATQTFSKAVVQPSVALTDGANIATDASLGNYFRVTLAGNRTLDNPTNPSDGQKVMWELIQDGTGTRTLAYGAAFAFGTDITAATLTTTASKRDFLTCIYNSTAAKWYVIAFIKGY